MRARPAVLGVGLLALMVGAIGCGDADPDENTGLADAGVTIEQLARRYFDAFKTGDPDSILGDFCTLEQYEALVADARKAGADAEFLSDADDESPIRAGNRLRVLFTFGPNRAALMKQTELVSITHEPAEDTGVEKGFRKHGIEIEDVQIIIRVPEGGATKEYKLQSCQAIKTADGWRWWHEPWRPELFDSID